MCRVLSNYTSKNKIFVELLRYVTPMIRRKSSLHWFYWAMKKIKLPFKPGMDVGGAVIHQKYHPELNRATDEKMTSPSTRNFLQLK